MAAALAAGCGGDGGDGQPDCSSPPVLALHDVVIDATTSTSDVTVSFELDIWNPATVDAPLIGYLLECSYVATGAYMIRGSGTSELVIGAGEMQTLSEPGCEPGVVEWIGSPSGGGLICEVEVLYSYEECEGPFPRATASVTGEDDIAILYP